MQSHPEAGPGFLKNQSIAVDHETPFQSGQQFMASFFKMIESIWNVNLLTETMFIKADTQKYSISCMFIIIVAT